MEEIHTLQPKAEMNFLGRLPTAEIEVKDPKGREADNEINLIPLKQVFNIQMADKQDLEQLHWIYNFFDKQGFQDMGSVLTEIQSIRNKLGNQPYGVSVLSHVYQYLKVLSQMTELEKVKKGFERYG